MKINYAKGSDALGLCLYLLDRKKQLHPQNDPVLATNMSGRDAEVLAAELSFSHRLNPRVKNTIAHFAVSLPPNETVSAEQIKRISKALLDKAGHRDCQFFVVQHHDREHRNGVQHWHIATSAVNLKGEWVNDAFIKLKLKTIERELEREFKLQYCEPKIGEKYLTTGEYRRKERTGEELPKEKLWRIIDSAAADSFSLAILVARLKAEGVTVNLRRSDEKIIGISYAIGRIAFAGRSLGKEYSLKGLQDRGIEHPPEEDQLLEVIETLNQQQIAERLERQQANYRAVYDRYTSNIEGRSDEEKDTIVAMRAAAEFPEGEVKRIVFYGNSAQKKVKEVGLKSAVEYLTRIVARALDRTQQGVEKAENQIKRGLRR